LNRPVIFGKFFRISKILHEMLQKMVKEEIFFGFAFLDSSSNFLQSCCAFFWVKPRITCVASLKIE
jgi:hypothetical protein